MKKLILPLLALLVIIACNTTDKKTDSKKAGDGPMTLVDSLLQQIDEGHNVGMSKIGKLHISKQQVENTLDSIGKLPAKAQEAAAQYIAQLKQAIKDLDYADMAMDKWMMEYNMDSVGDNAAQHLNYLKDETFKVGKVKEAILSSMQKADSLLKAKF